MLLLPSAFPGWTNLGCLSPALLQALLALGHGDGELFSKNSAECVLSAAMHFLWKAGHSSNLLSNLVSFKYRNRCCSCSRAVNKNKAASTLCALQLHKCADAQHQGAQRIQKSQALLTAPRVLCEAVIN